ncbi:hypothetical protein NJB1507_28940 [Mycobacterium marinum]|uniref:hypothetical protein n=1 Tax=Mycobacterium marinum TaxID=1781 RepID=UPI0021C37E77|nr:hypothetical protein [Mycobacterium marinum]GJO25524.1 hypothetical protein NJB1507_28940 [Mycobacterium marinum]
MGADDIRSGPAVSTCNRHHVIDATPAHVVTTVIFEAAVTAPTCGDDPTAAMVSEHTRSERN